MINFTGKEQQDIFAYMLLGKKATFLDVGCYHPIQWNNTYALEQIGWNGILVDIEQKWVDMCKAHRRSQVLKADVSSKNFVPALQSLWESKHFDYISMDADSGNVRGLEGLLKNGFTFNVMTYEHDSYQYGDERKSSSVSLLQQHGYFCLFEDVMCTNQNLVWEDWWINPSFFGSNITDLSSKKEHHTECISRLKKILEIQDGLF